jgi:hypothetical protein
VSAVVGAVVGAGVEVAGGAACDEDSERPSTTTPAARAAMASSPTIMIARVRGERVKATI